MHISNDMRILYIEILTFFLHCVNIIMNLALISFSSIYCSLFKTAILQLFIYIYCYY